MRIIFAGTPEFAAQALDALADNGHEILLVLTQPDRPAGRGMQPKPSAVKEVALRRNLPVLQPSTLKDEAIQMYLRELGAEVMVVAAYGLILPQAVLDIPPLGCLNIHASLLPRWRGAAPIQRAILAGDGESGVCIMQMEAGLDTGPVLLSQSVTIEPDEDAGSLHDKLAGLGSRLIVEVLAQSRTHPLQAVPQTEAGVTYAHKINRTDCRIDWSRPAEEIERQVRAFSPVPGAYSEVDGIQIKIWRARVVTEVAEMVGGESGHVLSADKNGILVACGQGALLISELQKAGGKRLVAAQFLAGTPLAGMSFS